MKTLIIVAIVTICLSVKAQDTLYFTSGEIQLVELISVNKEAGLIKYKHGEQTQIRSVASLKSFSNQSNIGADSWTLDEGTAESSTAFNELNPTSSKDPSKYRYSKFSFGANLLSSLSMASSRYQFTFASNYNQSFYVQYNFNNRFGVRLPMRIGFNQIKETTTIAQSGYPWEHNRELLGEGGIEAVIMKDDNRRITPYLMPGIYVGVNQGVITIYNDSIYTSSVYFPAPRHTYFRVGLTGGFQFNFSKHVQLNTELGLNYNNATVYYNPQYSSSIIPQNYYPHKRICYQAAVNLVYRFGGKLRE